MRRLTLLRHAKSSWDNPALNDFSRPLRKRGERDAPMMGALLRELGSRPSLIISSDAVRAITTARTVARAINYPLGFLQPDHRLYLASPGEIIETIWEEGEQYTDNMIVGHNPGLTELANLIGDMEIDNIPTCGVCTVDLKIDSWAELGRSKGVTAWFEYPKKIKARV